MASSHGRVITLSKGRTRAGASRWSRCCGPARANGEAFGGLDKWRCCRVKPASAARRSERLPPPDSAGFDCPEGRVSAKHGEKTMVWPPEATAKKGEPEG